MRIRAATPADYDAAASVWQRGWRSTGLTHYIDPSVESLRERIPREIEGGWSLFVAEEDGTIVGILALQRETGHLDQLFVDPEHHGKGIGRALLAFARAQMPGEIWLRCVADNEKAWCWYEREGFVFEKQEPHPVTGMPMKQYRWRA